MSVGLHLGSIVPGNVLVQSFGLVKLRGLMFPARGVMIWPAKIARHSSPGPVLRYPGGMFSGMRRNNRFRIVDGFQSCCGCSAQNSSMRSISSSVKPK